MTGFKPITANTPPDALPHINAEDDAAVFQSIVGDDGVFMTGQRCKATVISNNKVRISDGVLIVGGHFGRIPYGEYLDAEIANGQSGKKRNDLILAKFVTTGSGGIDTFTLEVKRGTAGTTAVDPVLTQQDLYQAGKTREFPLYRVRIEGLSIVGVDKLFTEIPTLPQINSNLGYEYGRNSNGHYKKYADGRLEMWGNYTTKAITYTEGYGNIYFSDEKNIVPPVADFVELQSGSVVCRSSGVIWICNCTISGIILKYRICQIGKDLTRSIDICWHAMGRWR